jgi:DNA-directed RNA polymerase subunit RPC12/RpoP
MRLPRFSKSEVAMIKFRCSNCGHKLGVPSTYVGKTVRCPHCQTGNRVKSPESSPPEALTEEAAASESASAREPVSQDAFEEQTAGHGADDDGLSALAAAGGDGGPDELAAAVHHPEPRTPSPRRPSKRPTPRPAAQPPAPAEPEPTPTPVPPSPSPSPAAATSSVRPTRPPDYTLLKIGAILIYVVAGLVVLISLGLTVLALVGGASTGLSSGVAGGIASAVTILFAGTLYAIILAVGGAALQALRDIARNSWYQRETVALLRAGR